jgi:UDP-glucose:(glucosyl)LPS alpha-1,2-glucosyltransferase
MGFAKDVMAPTAKGGTELMREELERRMPAGLLDNFQIFISRVHEPLDPNKIRIYWHQDLPWDPACAHLKDTKDQFDIFVFNSNWQMDMFNKVLGISYGKSIVVQNAINPIPYVEKPSASDGIVRIIYHTTPHRGLDLLFPIFQELCKNHENVELDVYSSFSIYGWSERDEPYLPLFEQLKNHPKIRYHGAVPNEEIRKALQRADIYAYPNIWPESSCISLMEAMSAGCICIHPNYSALYDTSGDVTRMYQWNENHTAHANIHYVHLDRAVRDITNGLVEGEREFVKQYADKRFNWDRRAFEWESILTDLRNFKSQ